MFYQPKWTSTPQNASMRQKHKRLDKIAVQHICAFAVKVDNGLCHCFVGCFDGNAYQFADKIGHPNPKQFINGESAEYKAIDGDTSAPDLEKMIHPLVENLL